MSSISNNSPFPLLDLPDDMLRAVADKLTAEDRKVFGLTNRRLNDKVSSLNPEQLFERLAIDSTWSRGNGSLWALYNKPNHLRFKIVEFKPNPAEAEWYQLQIMNKEPAGRVERFKKWAGNSSLLSYRSVFEKIIAFRKDDELLVMSMIDPSDPTKTNHYLIDQQYYLNNQLQGFEPPPYGSYLYNSFYKQRFLKLTTEEFNKLKKNENKLQILQTETSDKFVNLWIQTTISKIHKFLDNYEEGNQIFSCRPSDHRQLDKFLETMQKLSEKGLFSTFRRGDGVYIIPSKKLDDELKNKVKMKEEKMKSEVEQQLSSISAYLIELKQLIGDEFAGEIKLGMTPYNYLRRVDRDLNFKVFKYPLDAIQILVDNQNRYVFAFKEQWEIGRVANDNPDRKFVKLEEKS